MVTSKSPNAFLHKIQSPSWSFGNMLHWPTTQIMQQWLFLKSHSPNTMQWKKYETLFKAPNPFTFLIKTQNRNYLFMSWLLMEICSLFWRICWIYFEIFFFLVLLWKIVKHSFRLPKEVKLFGKFWCEHPMMTTKMIKWELGNKKRTYTLKS